MNLQPQYPFFVSQPAVEQVNPTFHIDQSEFLLPRPSTNDSTLPLADDEDLNGWEGLREERIRIKVFGRPRRSERQRERERGRGKEKATKEEDGDDVEAGWKVLTEWDVELSGLVSLGRNVRLDPSSYLSAQTVS